MLAVNNCNENSNSVALYNSESVTHVIAEEANDIAESITVSLEISPAIDFCHLKNLKATQRPRKK